MGYGRGMDGVESEKGGIAPETAEAFLSRLWQLGPVVAAGAPHSARLGIRFVSVDVPGAASGEDAGSGGARASMALDWRDDLVGDPDTGVLHGGAVTTLLDQTCGFAAMAGMWARFGTGERGGPTGVATLNLHIDYQRAAVPRETVIATAFAYRVSRHIAFLRGTAHHGDPDDPVATCQASFVASYPGA